MDLDTRNKVISAVLGVLIIILGVFLYQSITEPYQKVLEQQRITQEVRDQLVQLRDMLVVHDRLESRFPGSLDSLLAFFETNQQIDRSAEGAVMHYTRGRDTIISHEGQLQSILYSYRTNNRFTYTLNDTIRPQLYLLEDPDTDDHIGSLNRTTLRNATSWN